MIWGVFEIRMIFGKICVSGVSIQTFRFVSSCDFKGLKSPYFKRNETVKKRNGTNRNETDFNMLAFKTKRHETKRYIPGAYG